MLRRLAGVAAVCALALAGCGGSHHQATTKLSSGAIVGQCPPGQSFMGCSRPSVPAAVPRLTPPGEVGPTAPGPRFPDVSSWQGHPNWDMAKGHIDGAVAKASEYVQDPDFAYNVAAFKRLGIRWAAYDFVRSCNASVFIKTLRSVGGPTSAPPVLDEEVPAAKGCAKTLDAQIYAAFHRHAVEYTSPGTNPDGANNPGLNLWVAAYGPSLPCVFTCNVAVAGKQSIYAWQNTDGVFGGKYYIPGIGYGDVSVDYGLMAQQPAPPAPVKKPTPVVKPKPVVKPAGKQQASAEVQLSGVLTGSARITVIKGHWLIAGRDWRIRSMPYNAKPLGR